MKTIINKGIHIFIGYLLLTGCSNGQTEVTVNQKVENVRASFPQPVEIVVPVQATGLLTTRTQMKLSFKTGGIIDQINVREGQQVKEGTLLAKLDLAEINARVNQANTSFEKAKRDYNRVQNLYRDSVVTLETVQNARSVLDVARAEKRIADFNFKHSRIVAPTDGKIQKILSETNELSAPGHPVILFATTENDWIVRVAVSDKDIVRCSIDDSAIVRTDPFPNELFPGRISELGTFSDPVTGTYEIEILLKEQQRDYRTGFISHATIFPSDTLKALLLPLKAVVDIEGDYGYVFQVDSINAIKKKIRLGDLRDDGIVILEGLKPNQQVVVDGAGFLNNNDRINIVN